MKICCKCNIEKSDFHKNKRSKDGLNSWCKECSSEYQSNYRSMSKDKSREYAEKYYKSNKEVMNERSKKHRENNPEYYSEYMKNRRKDNPEHQKYYLENSDDIKFKNNEYRKNNLEYYSNYYRNYREKYPHISAWRNILKNTLSRMNKEKSSSTIEMLGYSADDLKDHIESLFIEGMNWSNHGEWHIDHIYPVSKFNPNTDVKEVNKLENLQPLWASDNLSKGDKLII